MDTSLTNWIDEEIELVPQSPESDDEKNYPTMEEEALKVADYLKAKNKRLNELAAQQTKPKVESIAHKSASSESEEEGSDEYVPTANLLFLSPATSKRSYRRKIVTQELQDMFGFEATPLTTTKKKTVRKRPKYADAPVCSDQGSYLDQELLLVSQFRAMKAKAMAGVNTRSQSNTRTPSKSPKKKSCELRSSEVSSRVTSEVSSRVTRRSVQLVEAITKKPITSKIDTGRTPARNKSSAATTVSSRRVSTTPHLGTPSVTRTSTRDDFRTPIKQSAAVKRPTATVRPSQTLKRVTPKIDTGRKPRNSVTPGNPKSTIKKQNSDVSQPSNIQSTPVRSSHGATKSKIDARQSTRRSTSIALPTPASASKSDQISEVSQPHKKTVALTSVNSARAEKSVLTSVHNTSLTSMPVNPRPSSHVKETNQSEVFKKPTQSLTTSRRSSQSKAGSRENMLPMVTRRRSVLCSISGKN